MTIEKSTKNLVFTNRVMGDRVFMLLDKGIGKLPDDNSPYISGSAFADETYYWKSQGKNIDVKINTLGGRTDDGWSIVDAIIETKANTQVIGMAYSMGGLALIAGAHRTAYSHARIMIHTASGKNGKKGGYIDIVNGQIRDLLKSRTKFTEAEITDMIDSGKDYFFTPKEALAKGMIDEIVDTKKTFNFSQEQLTDSRAMYLVYNSALKDELSSNSTNTEMEIFNKLFGGKSESENAIAAVQMQAENVALKAEKAAWQKEKETFEAKIKTLETANAAQDVKTKAKDLIEGAVKAGKLSFKDEATKNKAIEDATANFDATKSLIDSMPAKKEKAAAALPDGDSKKEENTYAWMMINAPEKLNALYESDPELFNKLSDDYVNEQSKNEGK